MSNTQLHNQAMAELVLIINDMENPTGITGYEAERTRISDWESTNVDTFHDETSGTTIRPLSCGEIMVDIEGHRAFLDLLRDTYGANAPDIDTTNAIVVYNRGDALYIPRIPS